MMKLIVSNTIILFLGLFGGFHVGRVYAYKEARAEYTVDYAQGYTSGYIAAQGKSRGHRIKSPILWGTSRRKTVLKMQGASGKTKDMP